MGNVCMDTVDRQLLADISCMHLTLYQPMTAKAVMSSHKPIYGGGGGGGGALILGVIL